VNGNPNRGNSRKRKEMNECTKRTWPALLIALGMALEARAADPSPQPPYSWRGIKGTGVFPAKDLVTTFCDYPAEMAGDKAVSEGVARAKLPCKPGDRKNIVWRTLLPHWGHNAPVCVRDRVFVLCDEGWKSDAPLLVCLDAKDGRILWQKPVDQMDAWPEEKAKVGKECRAKELKRWRDHMTWWNRFYWDNEKNAAAAATRTEADWNRLVEETRKDGWQFPSFANRSLRTGREVDGPGRRHVLHGRDARTTPDAFGSRKSKLWEFVQTNRARLEGFEKDDLPLFALWLDLLCVDYSYSARRSVKDAGGYAWPLHPDLDVNNPLGLEVVPAADNRQAMNMKGARR
jgi:hypothetical protein